MYLRGINFNSPLQPDIPLHWQSPLNSQEINQKKKQIVDQPTNIFLINAAINTGVLISPQPDQEGNKLHSPHFMELGGSLPHSHESTICPYPSQINPFLCPSHFRQAQPFSFMVGLRNYQHPGIYHDISARLNPSTFQSKCRQPAALFLIYGFF